jgi:hypothetical protein
LTFYVQSNNEIKLVIGKHLLNHKIQVLININYILMCSKQLIHTKLSPIDEHCNQVKVTEFKVMECQRHQLDQQI